MLQQHCHLFQTNNLNIVDNPSEPRADLKSEQQMVALLTKQSVCVANSHNVCRGMQVQSPTTHLPEVKLGR